MYFVASMFVDGNSSENDSSVWSNSTRPTFIDQDSLDTIFFVYYFGILVLLSIVGIIGNTMVIRALALHPSIRTPNNYFVLSLAVSDLFLGVAYPIYDVLHLSDKYHGDVFGALTSCDLFM